MYQRDKFTVCLRLEKFKSKKGNGYLEYDHIRWQRAGSTSKLNSCL